MDIKETAAWIRARDSFLIASHNGPDADGLGAMCALTLALRSLGKQAVALVVDALPQKFAFIDQQGLIRSLETGGALPFPAGEASFILIDTHDLAYVGLRAEELIKQSKDWISIDHHESRGKESGEHCLDPTASSSAELVYYLAAELGAAIGRDAAEAIFAGIVYDTGSFAYPKTGERTFACALELLRRGVRPYDIHTRMFESASVGLLKLEKAVLSTLELHAGNRVAVQTLRREDLLATEASYEDAEEFVNIPLRSITVEVSVLFKENPEGRLRCSIRSKGKVNVAGIAQSFGGGGHKTAAGFTCNRPLEAMKAAVLETIVRSLP